MLIKSLLFFQDADLQNKCIFAAKTQGKEFAPFVAEKVCEFILQKYEHKVTPKNNSDFYVLCQGYASKEKGVTVAMFIERACSRMVFAEANPSVWKRISNFMDLNATVKEEAVATP